MNDEGDKTVKLLVIGGGGREHAIAKKLLSSDLVETVFCAPGNAGMKKDDIDLLDIDHSDHDALIGFAKKENIAWTIVGPEIPLFNGIVDDFKAEGLKIFGPSKAATLIEASKEFAKELMKKNAIPTADHKCFDNYDSACNYLENVALPIVIKADGLAGGKGVVIAETKKEALAALKEMMVNQKYGTLCSKVVIEEFLTGEEFSLMAFVKGEKVYPMVISQDHKRLHDGDKGPNTGGMGAYAPVPHISVSVVKEAIDHILKPAALGMVRNGTPFEGILYAGVIATEEGPKTIEFNARFGDPETQVLLNRLVSDFASVITDILEDRDPDLVWKEDGVSLGVVVAAEGYPEEYETGTPLNLPDTEGATQLYFAGVKEDTGKIISNGGRIYLVEASGETMKDAQEKVYQSLRSVDTSGCVYRTDIGNRAL